MFGPAPVHRPDVLQQFKPALRLRGNADSGQGTFAARCASCHQAQGRNGPFGPDLRTARFKGKEKILEAILEPNTEVTPEYAPWTAESRAGENLIGVREEENLSAVTIRQLDGTRVVWPRLNLQAMESHSWSFMPTGLEEGLSTQDMADLLEYIVVGLK